MAKELNNGLGIVENQIKWNETKWREEGEKNILIYVFYRRF